MAPGRVPKIGSLFAKRYLVESVLGQGAVGIVFGVRDEKTGVACALKLLNRPEARVDAARVIREARALMLISNPHVVRVFDVAERQGYGPYLVLERLNGQTLADFVASGERVPYTTVARWAIEVCEALAHAHAAGVIHRDIKLSNLFLTREADGRELIKVLDFGIAKVATPGSTSPSTLTKETMLGSPQFISPEQLLRPRAVDARTDLWSLGVVMFRLLTGRFPFNGESVADLTSSVLKDPVPTLASLNVDAPLRVQAVLDKCFARELDQRWSSAQELQGALRAILTPELASSGMEGGAPRPKSAGRWLIAVGVSFVLVAIAATLFLLLGMRKGWIGDKQDGIELTLTADENIRSVRATGLRRLQIEGHTAVVVAAPWTGSLVVDADLESGSHAQVLAPRDGTRALHLGKK